MLKVMTLEGQLYCRYCNVQTHKLLSSAYLCNHDSEHQKAPEHDKLLETAQIGDGVSHDEIQRRQDKAQRELADALHHRKEKGRNSNVRTLAECETNWMVEKSYEEPYTIKPSPYTTCSTTSPRRTIHTVQPC